MAAGDLGARSGLSGGNEAGRLGAAFDAMVAQLQASFSAQRRFLADAAHELRTPLTAVGGQLELMLMGAAGDPARQRSLLQQMYGMTERMGRLVSDLLLLARLGAQPQQPRQRIELAALVRQSAEEFRMMPSQHQFELQAGEPVLVQGERDRLQQALLNVLENARKYTPEGGSIRLELSTQGGWAQILVQDSGCGIAEQELARVWEPFYRVDQTRVRSSGGAGLGLAITRSVIAAYGGQVALSSVPGLGTTVALRLPIVGD